MRKTKIPRATARRVLWSMLMMIAAASYSARGQDGNASDDVSKGHHVAAVVCAVCHVAADDQSSLPLLHPPAPPFKEIAQRKDLTAAWLENFLKTTHRDLGSQKGMPNPDLADFQIKEVVAYVLSLRK